MVETTARRWSGGWELHVAGHGVTQVHDLAGAEATVRDYLRLDGVPTADTVEVRVVVEGGA